jgi:2-dehydro-3-deoxy-L-rhamnonate dehydrogenase (NAD+)
MNKIDLTQRSAIVTGGARGIGLAIARRLLESGASVSLWDVDDTALAQASEELKSPGKVHTATVDVTRADSAEAAAASTAQALGKLDILVNNAGVAGTNAKTWETDPAEWRRVLDISTAPSTAAAP